MFTPGGGRALPPSWFGADWARSGEQHRLSLELDFFEDDYGPAGDEPLTRTQARKCFTRSSSLDEKAEGVAWGMVELGSPNQALLVWSIDLPNGISSETDVSLPEGTRLFCSTQVWRGEVKPAARSVKVPGPYPGSTTSVELPTVEVPGPWPGTVTIGTQGQLAVQRISSSGKLLNPFENAGKFSSFNPFAQVPEFGVVGWFELGEAPRSGLLDSQAAQEVEVILD